MKDNTSILSFLSSAIISCLTIPAKFITSRPLIILLPRISIRIYFLLILTHRVAKVFLTHILTCEQTHEPLLGG